MREDREGLMMRMVSGDMGQYEILKRSSVKEFLVKFGNFVDEIALTKKK